MSHFKIHSFFILFILLMKLAVAQPLISDQDAREQMLTRYEERVFTFQDRIPGLFDYPDTIQDQTLREATMFLLAYAPLSDLANLDVCYFRKQAELALMARDTFAWGSTVPEDVFRYFVLPYRVNNENPDTARFVFFKELYPRIHGLSMYEAALEVNHWCHEKVAYKGTDERTSSPLATVMTAFGRCGEESTFTVAAMRSVGIPARQVYTPRWAHTDDNHAWVEVWIEGKWYFLGACEPAPELNMGWFAGPATRTIMVHTNTFGFYNGSEKVLVKTPLFSKLNLLANYAPTRKAVVNVVDENGIAKKNVSVDYMVYNYAEFYPFASLKTDENGMCFIETGLGDILVWATDGNSYCWSEFSALNDDTLQLILPSNPVPFIECNDVFPYCIYDMSFTPPSIGEIFVPSSDRAVLNETRLLREDSIRSNYESSFPDSISFVNSYNDINATYLFQFVKKSRGNFSVIAQFYKEAPKQSKTKALDLLSAITEKDLRDVTLKVLNDHLINSDKYKCTECVDYDMFVNYVLSPRIGKELLTPWRGSIQKSFNKKQIKIFRKDPERLVEWIKNHIDIDNVSNYYGTPLSAEGVLKLGIADKYSRDIFFVACCRSFSIPARLEPATGYPQYFDDNKWITVLTELSNGNIAKGILILSDNGINKPKYTVDFTISKLIDGRFITLDYEFDEHLRHFPCTLGLDRGTYRLMTGNRKEDGTVYTHWSFFNIEPNDTSKVLISFYDPGNSHEKQISLHLDSCDFTNPITEKRILFNEMNSASGLVIVLIDPLSEPGKHFLAELQESRGDFESWNGQILLVLPQSRIFNEFIIEQYSTLPSNAIWLLDNNGSLESSLIKQLNIDIQLPVVLYLNSSEIVEFLSKGYQINTAAMLYKSIQRSSHEVE